MPTVMVSRAFMPMTMALNSSHLKLKAYRAFDTARLLHEDERCILLGEVLAKDATDPDPNVRLAAVNALFSTLTQAWDETCRGDVVVRVIRHDPHPGVRLRALEGLMSLAEDVYNGDAIQERAQLADELLGLYENVLQQLETLMPDSKDSLVLAKHTMHLSTSASALGWGK